LQAVVDGRFSRGTAVLLGVGEFDGRSQVDFEPYLVILVGEEVLEVFVEDLRQVAVGAFLVAELADVATSLEVVDEDVDADLLREQL
jgi:hypothetical protein